MVTTRSGLLCFDSSRYWVSDDRDDNKCIAPTGTGSRCSFDISETELNEIAELTVEFLRARNDTGVDQVLQRLVLLRCCGDRHRQKLEHSPDVLIEVANRYRRVLASSPEPRIPRRPIRRGYDSPGRWQWSPEVRHRYLLRPRVSSNGSRPPVLPEVHAQLFILHAPDPNKTLNTVLKSDVPQTREYRRDGEVYAFTWPTAPGFIKIGYTSASVTARMNKWRECHAESKLIHRVAVEFPHRIEELIHLQLKDKQHKIVICKTCGSTHYEWFQESVERVKTIMDAWKEISDRTPLYDPKRRLAERWQNDILPYIDGDYRAGKLLRALNDSDAELARAAEEEEEQTRRENEERIRREEAEATALHERLEKAHRREAEANARNERLQAAIERQEALVKRAEAMIQLIQAGQLEGNTHREQASEMQSAGSRKRVPSKQEEATEKPTASSLRRDSALAQTQPPVLSAPEDVDAVVDAFADFFRMLEVTRAASLGQLATVGVLNTTKVQLPEVPLGRVAA